MENELKRKRICSNVIIWLKKKITIQILLFSTTKSYRHPTERYIEDYTFYQEVEIFIFDSTHKIKDLL